MLSGLGGMVAQGVRHAEPLRELVPCMYILTSPCLSYRAAGLYVLHSALH